MRGLEPRMRTVWVLLAVASAAVLGLLAGAALWLLPPELTFASPAIVGVVVLLAVAVPGVAYAVAYHRSWRFELRDDHLFLERGVLTRVTTMVPHVRVQHVDARRTVLDRVADLAHVVVYTAGSRGADVAVPGLAPADAEALQGRLRDVAVASEDAGRDAV